MRQLRLGPWPSTSCSGSAPRSARGVRCPPRCAWPSSRRVSPAQPSRGARRARAREVGRPAGLELQCRRRDRLEKPAVVRDDDAGGPEILELLLQPLQVRDVEMVRRLVEEKEVGLADERTGERRLRHLSAGECLEEDAEICVGEPETAGDRGGTLPPDVTSRVLEALLSAGVGRERLRVVRAPRHRLLQAAQVGLQLERLARAADHVGLQAQIEIEWRSLVVGATRVPRRTQARRRPTGTSASMRRRVVLPAPFGPRSATRSRRPTANETSLKSPACELLAQIGRDDDRHGLER